MASAVPVVVESMLAKTGTGSAGSAVSSVTPGMGAMAITNALTSTLSSVYALKQQSDAHKGSASSYYRQSMLQTQQGDYLLSAARANSGMAKKMIEIGKINASYERQRAGQVQYFIDQQQSGVVKVAQQKVGEGLAGFAANGILLEGREGSATAMWEQDEAADAAYQQLIVAQKGQDTIWEYLVEANNREAEGYGQAANMWGRAAEYAGQAYSAHLGSYESWKAGDAAREAAKKAKRGIGGVIGGAVGGAVIGLALAPWTGGMSLSAMLAMGGTYGGIGASVGTSVGQGAQYW